MHRNTSSPALPLEELGLQEREYYLRATLDNLPFHFWLKDSQGRYLVVNQAFADACGCKTPGDVVGLSDTDLWPEAQARKFQEIDRRVMLSQVEETRVECDRDMPAPRWSEVFVKPLASGSGVPVGTVGFLRDVTERQVLQDALARSEERWELAVRGTNDGIWDLNPATEEVYFSPRCKAMLGYEEGDIGPHVDEWISRLHPDEQESVRATLRSHFRGESEYYQNEYRMRCKDGSYKWILARGRALFNANGVAVRMLGSHTDVTEKKLAKFQLQERNEQLDAIFELSPDGFVSFDSSQCVKYASPSFASMTGVPIDQIIGTNEQKFSDVLAARCTEFLPFFGVAALRERQLSRGTSQRQFIEIWQDGRRVIEVGLRLGTGQAVSYILYFRDVTHETEVDQIKSDFLATAAHELRTPMTSILGFSEVLLTQTLEESARKELQTIVYKQSELMATILDELLDLARIEARQGKDFTLVSTPVQTLIHAVAHGFELPNGRSPVVLAMPCTEVNIFVDPQKTKQAVLNVLANAYKYSPDGGEVRIDVLTPEAQAGSCALVGICISDQGIGMTEDQASHVFERFYRADTSGKILGTGLGMSIVHEIVTLQGGRVDVQSTVGVGTTVTLWMPTRINVESRTL